MPSPAIANHSISSQTSIQALAVFTSEIDKLTTGIDVSAKQIRILRSPSEFYNTLKNKISHAKRRIYLSTLYIGKDEHDLLSCIRNALINNPSLQVTILVDALRGNRESPKPSCLSLVAELTREFPGRAKVHAYHTPNLAGLRRALLPKRINEGWGLQHMKLYGIDDEIIMSGANLSGDYFTDRQDRYHLISSKKLTDFFKTIHDAICSISYAVQPGLRSSDPVNLLWTNDAVSEPTKSPSDYIEAATRMISPLLHIKTTKNDEGTDTRLYPLMQFSPVLKPDTSTELPIMKFLLKSLASQQFKLSKWVFTAGYFNMTAEIRDLLLASKPMQGTVIAASPWANGFYGSKGISSMLPAAYTHTAQSFLKAVNRSGLSTSIELKEWRNGTVNTPGGWTYHAKGLWITLPNQIDPSITLIGSSNYTKRSYSLDLEANVLIVTQNDDLKKRLGQEQSWLQNHAQNITLTDLAKTERRVGFHVRLAMWIVTLLGGAL